MEFVLMSFLDLEGSAESFYLCGECYDLDRNTHSKATVALVPEGSTKEEALAFIDSPEQEKINNFFCGNHAEVWQPTE